MKYAILTESLGELGVNMLSDAMVVDGPYVGGVLLAASRALADIDKRLELELARLGGSEEPRARPEKRAKPAAAAGERKRAARGIGPCTVPGKKRHTFDAETEFCACGLNKNGQRQETLPGSGASS